jgi:DNA-directed RNA polymerase specialized sigma24 family protein
VIDYAAPSSVSALAELQKKEVRDHLLKFATWRCGSEATAEDLIADALLLVCDPAEKPWDPAKGSFTRHMRMLIQDLVIQRARTGYGRYETAESGLVMDESTESPALPPDEQLHEERDLAVMRELFARTIARIEKSYPHAKAICELLPAGFEKPADIARELGLDAAEVYETLKALKRHGPEVRAEWERAERARMQELRARATKKKEATR